MEKETELQMVIRLANGYLDHADNGKFDPDHDTVVLSRQFLRAIEREMELKHRLEVVLPMAKAHAHKGGIGPNLEKIIWAEEYLNQITEKNPHPLEGKEVDG